MSDTVTRTDRLKAAHDKLQEAVQSIVTGDDWQKMLKTAAKFHRYSTGGVTYSKSRNGADESRFCTLLIESLNQLP